MDKNHPLADKELLEWKDIAAYDLATFNKSFTTYELVAEKLKNKKIETNFTYLSSAWDFLTESTYKNDMITILPLISGSADRIKQIIMKLKHTFMKNF